MLSCREVSHFVSTEGGEPVRLRTRLQIRLHLLMCVHCRRYLRQLNSIGRGARRILDRTDPGSAVRVRRRILAAMDTGDPRPDPRGGAGPDNPE